MTRSAAWARERILRSMWVAALVVAMGVVAALAPAARGATATSNQIMGASVLTANQMATFALARNAGPKIAVPMAALARMFLEEGAAEGVRGDVAFAQALHETGYFAFGGSALPEWNNYCGLGVTGVRYVPSTATEQVFADGVTVIRSATGGSVGVRFAEPRLGVRAQIQHLKAYASTLPLNLPVVDPRYGYVAKGIAPTWQQLNGRWAVPGTTYGQQILSIYAAMAATPADGAPASDQPTSGAPSAEPLNLARVAGVSVSASSQNAGTSQVAGKVVDGVAAGFPGDYSREWATVGGRGGSWVEVAWPYPVRLDRVVLHDRPNGDDQVLAGTLSFSDSSSVPVGALANGGSATAVGFAARTVTSVRFTVTSVSASTVNIGLSEIEAWGVAVP